MSEQRLTPFIVPLASPFSVLMLCSGVPETHGHLVTFARACMLAGAPLSVSIAEAPRTKTRLSSGNCFWLSLLYLQLMAPPASAGGAAVHSRQDVWEPRFLFPC